MLSNSLTPLSNEFWDEVENIIVQSKFKIVTLITRVIQKVKASSTCFATLPPCNLDLAPSYFHVFTHLRQFFGDTLMDNDEGVKTTVKDWFRKLVAHFYDTDMQKFITQYDKCLNCHGHYVEKLFKTCSGLLG
jgi:hypothetical protein